MSFKPKDDNEDIKSSQIYIDFSDLLIFKKEELDKTLSRLPDLRLKSDGLDELVSRESNSRLKVLESHKQTHSSPTHSSTSSSMSKKIHSIYLTDTTNEHFNYSSPIPQSMSHLNLNDFCGTEIDWKMLTLSRPVSVTEENYFSKLIELYKLRHKTRIEDGYGFRKAVFRISRHPRVMQYKPVSLKFDSFDYKFDQNSKNLYIKEDITYESYERVAKDIESNTQNEESIAAAKELLSSAKSFDLKSFTDHK